MVLTSALGLQRPPIAARHPAQHEANSGCCLRHGGMAEHQARLRASSHAAAGPSSSAGQRLSVVAQAAAAARTPPSFMPAIGDVLPSPAPSGLNDQFTVFTEEHRIRGYEAGPDQRCTISSVANILQEVASNHAVAMWGRSDKGFAADPALADQGLIYVMTRMQIQIDEYPKWGQLVRVQTWFMAQGRVGAQRDFTITCARTGRQLGRATSSWVMINLNTRRLSKMPDEVREKFSPYCASSDMQAIAPEYQKHKIPDVGAEIVGPNQVARRSDIDMNGHVNNVTYLAWGLEIVPEEVYDRCHLYQVEIDYKAECHCGDTVECLGQRSQLPEFMAANGAGPEPIAFVHTLRRCEGGNCTELVRMRSIWRCDGAADAAAN